MQNSKGFGILEVIVASTVAVVLSLSIGTLMINSFKQTKQISFQSDAESFSSELNWFLSEPENCKSSFAGLNAAATSIGTITKLMQANPPAEKYKVGAGGIGQTQMKIKSYELRDGGDTSVASNTTNLYVTLEVTGLKSDGSGSTFTQKVRLYVNHTAGAVTSCRSLGGMQDIWTREPGAPNNIFYSLGNVGIGISNPSQALEVHSLVTGGTGYIYNNKPDGGLLFGTDGVESRGGLGVSAAAGNWTVDSAAGDVTLRVLQGGSINFATSATVAASTATRMKILNNGNIGIGSNDPKSKLDIQGGIKIGNEPTCDTAREGTVRYQAGTKSIQFCNGTAWVTFVDPGAMCTKMGGTWDAVTETCSGALGGSTCKASSGQGLPGGGLMGYSPSVTPMCTVVVEPPLPVLSIPAAERDQYGYAPIDGSYGGFTEGVGYVGSVVTMPTAYVAIRKKISISPGSDVPHGVTCRLTGSCPGPMGGSWTSRFNCVNGNPITTPVTNCPGGEGGATCFTRDSMVLMADGTRKKISEVQVGEWVRGESGAANQITGIDHTTLGNRRLMSMNGSEFFVTDDHPIGVATGWATFHPQKVKTKLDSAVQKLLPGQILKKSHGSEVLLNLDLRPDRPDLPLVQLHLDGDHTYYVNDFLVHNCGMGGGGGVDGVY